MDDLGDRQSTQTALQGDLELVTRYGEKHPGTWAGVWFDSEPTVRVVGAFTSGVAEHEAALRPRLRHPDRVVLQTVPHSLSELRRIRQEIESTLRQRAEQTGHGILTSIGQGKAVIHVSLRPDQEDVARELAARYGSAVELRVGAFGFPDRRRRARPGQPGRPVPDEQAIEGLEVSVEVDRRVLEVGDDGHGRLVLRNNGSGRIGPLHVGQPLVGSLLDTSHEDVGGYVGWIAGTGRIIDLAPGQSASVNVIVGTASTRAELGYAVPPGSYWLKVRMPFQQGSGGPTRAVTAPLTQITVVSRA